MPRTQLSRKADARRDLEMEIRQSMKELHITQKQIGQRLGMTGAGVCSKIRKCQWEYSELVEVMEMLMFPPEKILYFASGGRYRKTA